MKIEDFVENMPPIPENDFEYVKTLFPNYIFFKRINTTTREFFCTACKKTFFLQWPFRTIPSSESNLYYARHREFEVCPKCGQKNQVLNAKCFKNMNSLNVVKAFIFIIPISYDEVCFRCDFIEKAFKDNDASYYSAGHDFYRLKKNMPFEFYTWNGYFGTYDRTEKLKEPFYDHWGMGSKRYEFDYIGVERLKETFFKYSHFMEDTYETTANSDLVYLSLFSRYPRLFEMLLKLGYSHLICDIKRGKKNASFCNWNATNPKDFFKLNKQELIEWKRHGNDSKIADIYVRLFNGEKNGFSQAEKLLTVGGNKSIKKYATKLNVRIKDILKYLVKSNAPEAKSAYSYWIDYIEAAQDVGYDLSVHNVVFPRNLNDSHDNAVENQKILEIEKENKAVNERYTPLTKKYFMEKDGYLIRPPSNATEILKEGKKLHHCVGGYAARHASGQTTILFMRSSKHPNTSLYTIEIIGKNVKQVYGYKNQTTPTDNPEAKKFYDEWLAWVKKGSPHKKNSKNKPAVPAEIGA